MDLRHSREIQARRREELEIDVNGIPRSNDPLVLAGVISRNRSMINEGWKELEKLNQRLESLSKGSAFTPDI